MTSDHAFDVVVVGSANLDLVALAKRLPHPGETVSAHGYFEACGGKGANQAIAASRAGARTAFVGAVGRDEVQSLLQLVAGQRDAASGSRRWSGSRQRFD